MKEVTGVTVGIFAEISLWKNSAYDGTLHFISVVLELHLVCVHILLQLSLANRIEKLVECGENYKDVVQLNAVSCTQFICSKLVAETY